MVRFTLRQCAYFRAVAEQGGIAQAARVLNISQPSVAQAIDKLEDVTGLVLFERHHARGLTLTLQGRLFLEHVKRLDEQALHVEREASALATEAAGEIRLGVFWTLSPFYTAGLIRSFNAFLPKVIVQQQEMALADLSHAVHDGIIDIALTYDRGGAYEGLELVRLATLRPMVVLAADHPLAQRQSVNLKELAEEAYVMLDGPGSRGYFEDLLAQSGITPRVSYVSTSMETVRGAVASKFGFTLLVMQPPSATTYDGGQVKAVEIENNVQPISIVLAMRNNVHRGIIMQRFVDHAIDFFTIRHDPLH